MRAVATWCVVLVVGLVVVLATLDTATSSGGRRHLQQGLLSALRSHLSLSQAKRDVLPNLRSADRAAATGGPLHGKCNTAPPGAFDFNQINQSAACESASWKCRNNQCKIIITPCLSSDASTLQYYIDQRRRCVDIYNARFLPGQPIRLMIEGHMSNPDEGKLLIHAKQAYIGNGKLEAYTEIDQCFLPKLVIEGTRTTCAQL